MNRKIEGLPEDEVTVVIRHKVEPGLPDQRLDGVDHAVVHRGEVYPVGPYLHLDTAEIYFLHSTTDPADNA